MPTLWMATPIREEFIMVNMAFSPSCGSPSSQPLLASNRSDAVADPAMPILRSMDRQFTPFERRRRTEPLLSGSSLGTTKRLIPRVPPGASGRRASTRWTMFCARS